MRGLELRRNFNGLYDDFRKKLAIIREACQSLRNSTNFREILDVILLVGNYMNDSRKQASGFRLQSLARMTGVKDERNVSFLHHVEKVVRVAFPDLQAFIDDLKPCQEAAASTIHYSYGLMVVSILDLERECSECIESVRNVQRSCDTGNLSDPDVFHPQDRSLKLILSFLHEAQKKARGLSGIFDATIKTEFEGVMRYFGEDPTDRSSRAGFFRRFADFILQYQNAKKDNLIREESRRKDEARKKVLGTGGKVNGLRNPKALEENNKIMDDLLEKLRVAPKDSTRHQRRRQQKRDASGRLRSAMRAASAVTEPDVDSASLSDEPPRTPTVASVASEIADDGEELDLGKVAQGLLAGLKGGDDLLASFRQARKNVNTGILDDEGTGEDALSSPAGSNMDEPLIS